MTSNAYKLAQDAAMVAHYDGQPVRDVVTTALETYEANADLPDDEDNQDPGSGEEAKRNRWKMFPHIRYKNRPDLEQYGFEPDPKIWYEKAYGMGDIVTSTPSSDQLRTMAIQSPRVVIHDIENRLKANNWVMTQPIADIYVNTLQRFKQHHRSDGLNCLYATTTRRDFWRAEAGEGTEQFMDWQRENDKRQDIADAVDALMPSLYHLTADLSRHLRFMRHNIDEAVRTGKGKRIYPFIWPEYHSALIEKDERARTPVPADQWREALELLWDHPSVDGFVLWNLSEKKNVDFKDIPDWWEATVEFINDHKLA